MASTPVRQLPGVRSAKVLEEIETDTENESISSESTTEEESSVRGRRRCNRRRKFRRQKKEKLKPRPKVNLCFNCCPDIPLTEAMQSVVNCGPGYVFDRRTANPVDINVGRLRMDREMDWDAYFQLEQIKKREEEGSIDEEEESQNNAEEKRVLKDPEIKTNLPKKWKKPAAPKDFQSANCLNVTSPANLAKIHPNTTPIK